jgi:hypothetical protein
MRRFSATTTALDHDFEGEILDEERVRDQVSVAEELLHMGYREPAVVAGGAAIEGVIRIAGGVLAGYGATAGALLEALLASRAVDEEELGALSELLLARDRLVHGFALEDPDLADADRLAALLEVGIRLLEPTVLRPNPN